MDIFSWLERKPGIDELSDDERQRILFVTGRAREARVGFNKHKLLSEAVVDLEGAISNSPSDWLYYHMLCSYCIELRRHRDAAIAERRALELRPEDVRTWHGLGSVFQHLSRARLAPALLAEMDQLLASNNPEPARLLQMGMAVQEIEALYAGNKQLGITPDEALEWAVALFSGALRLASSGKDRRILETNLSALVQDSPELRLLVADESRQRILVSQMRAHPFAAQSDEARARDSPASAPT
jgi:hypothetical protein